MSTKRSVDRETLRIFWQTGKQNKRELLIGLTYPIGAIAVSVLAPLYIGKILASLAVPGADHMHYVPYFVAAAIIGILCNRWGFANVLMYQAKTMSQLQAKALDALLKRSTGFHHNNVGGKLVSDATDFPQAFALLSNALFINLIPFGIMLVAGTLIVFMQSWVLGVVTLAMAVYALGSGMYESRKRAPVRASRLAITKAVTSHLADTIVNVQTVKTFAREQEEYDQHKKMSHKLLERRIADWRSAGYLGNRRMAVLLTLQLVFVLLTIWMVQRDPALLGIGIFAFSFSIMLSNRLFEVNSLMRNIEDGLLNASPMTEVLAQKPEVVDAPNASELQLTKGAISFDNVSFAYTDSGNNQAVFANLNLHVQPGERVGLVGPSGGGKSTLTRLVLRFDDINSGTITIDGQNIAEVTQRSLREAVSYVPQEPLLFHRSIAENIAYGKADASLKAVKRSAASAHADDFIEKLGQGYDTIVGERGVKLSGGQRQRVAIARAILKDAPILILDEATSALDSESEVLIQDALWKLMEGRTAIVIAHRLSTIQKMDRILVLEDGKITEEGTHKELLKKKNGTYARLWAHQSGGFIDDNL